MGFAGMSSVDSSYATATGSVEMAMMLAAMLVDLSQTAMSFVEMTTGFVEMTTLSALEQIVDLD